MSKIDIHMAYWLDTKQFIHKRQNMPVKIREKPNITKAVFEKKDEQCLFDTKLVSES